MVKICMKLHQKLKSGPGSVGWSIIPIHQLWVQLLVEHMRESTNECMDVWSRKFMFLSPSSFLSLKSINLKKDFGYCHIYLFLNFCSVTVVPPFSPLLSPTSHPTPTVNPLPLSVLNFQFSGSILLSCLFCWLGSTYRWDHMVFIFHHMVFWLISHSIRLSSSIHAVAKGRSSFFLSTL